MGLAMTAMELPKNFDIKPSIPSCKVRKKKKKTFFIIQCLLANFQSFDIHLRWKASTSILGSRKNSIVIIPDFGNSFWRSNESLFPISHDQKR